MAHPGVAHAPQASYTAWMKSRDIQDHSGTNHPGTRDHGRKRGSLGRTGSLEFRGNNFDYPISILVEAHRLR